MALINNIYVLAEEESVENNVDTTSHPTESGIPLSDTVREKPIVISISGVIADTEKVSAKTAINKLKNLQNKGSLIKYVGKAGTFSNLQIQSFHEGYNNKSGVAFDMSLKEIKTAESAYVKPKTTKSKKGTLDVGDTVLFLGGYVYVSSDASKHSAKRGKSTCKLTKISTLPNAKHKYHLISTDGRLVYGWVDKAKIQTIESSTSNESSGGTQQINETKKPLKHHTVKKGQTIWGLVNEVYLSDNYSVSQIMADNPTAFSRAGDATTLKVGSRLVLKTHI